MKTYQYRLSLSSGIAGEIKGLARKRGVSAEDIIAKALKLYLVAAYAEEDGGAILLQSNPDAELIKLNIS